MSVEARVAIVTGAGTLGQGVGVGKAIAAVLAREGAKLVLVDVDKDRVAETEEMVRLEGEQQRFLAWVTSAIQPTVSGSSRRLCKRSAQSTFWSTTPRLHTWDRGQPDRRRLGHRPRGDPHGLSADVALRRAGHAGSGWRRHSEHLVGRVHHQHENGRLWVGERRPRGAGRVTWRSPTVVTVSG